MKKQQLQHQEIRGRLNRYAPYATILVLLVVSYFALFNPGTGFTNSAQAQVNIGRVGEAVTDTVSEATSEREAEINQAETEIEQPSEEGATPGATEPMPSDQAPEESVEMGTGRYFPDTGPGSIWYTDSAGIAGTKIYDMTPAEIYQTIIQLEQLQGSVEAANMLMPILLRFQEMVRPPVDEVFGEVETPPWDSGARRYSPFDPVGMGEPTASRRYEPVPPFTNPLPGLPQTRASDQVTAARLASGLTLIGVFGEPGNYRAILKAGDYEKTLGVGDEVITFAEKTYIIEEISLLNVKIVNRDHPDDTALVSFVNQESSGISEVSFSYD